MKLTGFIITLWGIIGFWPTDSIEGIHLREVAFIEQADATPVHSLPSECIVIPVTWAEVIVLCRRQRPCRNPLRRLRKKLRAEKRKKGRLLKGGDQEVSAAEAVPLVEEELEVELEATPLADAPEQFPPGKKRGKKATIPTNHVFCPNENCRGYQVSGPHPDHRIIGAGTYTTKWGQRRQLYRCQLCKKPFSETQRTVFFGLKSDLSCPGLLMRGHGHSGHSTSFWGKA